MQATIETDARTRTVHDLVNAFESQGGVVLQIRGDETQFVEGADLISVAAEES